MSFRRRQLSVAEPPLALLDPVEDLFALPSIEAAWQELFDDLHLQSSQELQDGGAMAKIESKDIRGFDVLLQSAQQGEILDHSVQWRLPFRRGRMADRPRSVSRITWYGPVKRLHYPTPTTEEQGQAFGARDAVEACKRLAEVELEVGLLCVQYRMYPVHRTSRRRREA